MNKLITILFLSAVFALQSQKAPDPVKGTVPTEKSEIPTLVTEKFTKEHPAAQATWTKEGENYKAEFVNPENRMPLLVVYDRSGNELKKESPVEQSTPPAVVPEDKVQPKKQKKGPSRKN